MGPHEASKSPKPLCDRPRQALLVGVGRAMLVSVLLLGVLLGILAAPAPLHLETSEFK